MVLAQRTASILQRIAVTYAAFTGLPECGRIDNKYLHLLFDSDRIVGKWIFNYRIRKGGIGSYEKTE